MTLWHRHLGSGDSQFHTGTWELDSFVTDCRGRWPVNDAIETHDDPPEEQRCGWCSKLTTGVELDQRGASQRPESTNARLQSVRAGHLSFRQGVESLSTGNGFESHPATIFGTVDTRICAGELAPCLVGAELESTARHAPPVASRDTGTFVSETSDRSRTAQPPNAGTLGRSDVSELSCDWQGWEI